MAWNDDLRPDQAAAASTSSAHGVLLAGPGTGKTFVLVRRIQYLVEEVGVDPASITALTFTRAAAAEMKGRLEERFSAFRVRVSTLHSFALQELISHGVAEIQRPIRIVDDWEQRHVVEEEIKHLLASTIVGVRDGFSRLSDDWDTLAADGDGWEEGFPDPAFLAAWQRHREVYRYTLRSELVYQLLQAMREDHDFSMRRNISHLLVDEYQDLNRCDLDAVRLIQERTGAAIFAVGDDDQSIYSFRHAHPDGIRRFDEDYPEAGLLTLVECMRCGEGLVMLANWLIEQDADRVDKELKSITTYDTEVRAVRFGNQYEEASGVAHLIRAEVDAGCKPEDVLVLIRSDANGQISVPLVDTLDVEGISSYLPRHSPDSGEDLQRLISYLKLAESARLEQVDDLALRTLLELEDNGIGATRLFAVVRHALDWRVNFSDAIDRLGDDPQQFSSTGIESIVAATRRVMDRAISFQVGGAESFGDWIERVSTDLNLVGDTLKRVREATDEMVELLAGTSGGTVDAPIDFVVELSASLSGLDDSRPTFQPGCVTITSMHGAKGLSADVVFVLQVEDEVMPGDVGGHEYDEARRLLYVSLTRAKRKLFICACIERLDRQEFVRSRRQRRRSFSRFLRGYELSD